MRPHSSTPEPKNAGVRVLSTKVVIDYQTGMITHTISTGGLERADEL